MSLQFSLRTVSAVLFAIIPAYSGAVHAQETYKLQPGDVIEISVWEEPELVKEVLIRPDGGLSFPLVGDISAAGRSVEEIRETVALRLSEFIAGAAVNVAVLRTSGSRVFVVGRVLRSGAYPLDAPLDVLQALTLAGGTTEFADLGDIRVIRRTEAGSRSIPFDYDDVARGKRLEQNVLLESGDTVVVP